MDMALLVLGLSVFNFWMVVFLALNPVGLYLSTHSFCWSIWPYVTDFNTCNKLLTRGFLGKAISVINFARLFLNFVASAVVWCLDSRLGLDLSCARGLSEPGFYGDLVYRLKKIVGSNGLSGSGVVLDCIDS